MKIIQKRERIETISHTLFFENRNIPGAGWAPKCDEHGNVDESKMMPAALAEWSRVQLRIDSIRAGTDSEYRPPVVQDVCNRYTQPAIGLCDDCGAKVYLDGFTNTCECGADYNMSGQRLASREFWGECTGEHISDILMADSDYDYGCE